MTIGNAFFLAGLAVTGLLVPLLLATFYGRGFRIWPTPAGTCRSKLFWTLFRALNVLTFATAATATSRLLDLPDALRAAALAVLLAFGAIYIYALVALGKANTYCEQTGLVTGGIYRWTRNPQYSTVIPVYAALAVATDSGQVYLLAMAMITVYVLMALAEEPWLAAAYGAAYHRYCGHVPRFFNWRRALVLARWWARSLQRHLPVVPVIQLVGLGAGPGSMRKKH